jgi:hypothetical protein
VSLEVTVELLIVPTHEEALRLEHEHALSMAAAYHEIVATSSQPPDKLLALLDQEQAWKIKAERANLRCQSLAERSVTAA